MPSIMSLLLHPERRRPGPPPQQVDLRRVFLAGIAAWTVALAVSVVLLALERATTEVVVSCAVGVLLGGLGLLWERRNRHAYRGED